jgi:hypothetical protein
MNKPTLKMPDAVKAAFDEGVNPWAQMILLGLQRKTQYMGTVPHAVKLERRARNKRARIARRINRGI